jgi:hypothetical protein
VLGSSAGGQRIARAEDRIGSSDAQTISGPVDLRCCALTDTSSAQPPAATFTVFGIPVR